MYISCGTLTAAPSLATGSPQSQAPNQQSPTAPIIRHSNNHDHISNCSRLRSASLLVGTTVRSTYPLMSWIVNEAMKRVGTTSNPDTSSVVSAASSASYNNKSLITASDFIINSIDSNKKNITDCLEVGSKKMPPTLAVSHLNIDSENYMLRSCELRPRSSSFTNGTRSTNNGTSQFCNNINFKGSMSPLDLDMFSIREKVGSANYIKPSSASSLPASSPTPPLSEPVTGDEHDNLEETRPRSSSFLTTAASTFSTGLLHSPISESQDSSNCAQSISLHKLLCSCHPSCCCMCLCFPECQACFHSVCIAYSGNHPCQRNNDIPTPTLNKAKVRHIFFFSLSNINHTYPIIYIVKFNNNNSE